MKSVGTPCKRGCARLTAVVTAQHLVPTSWGLSDSVVALWSAVAVTLAPNLDGLLLRQSRQSESAQCGSSREGGEEAELHALCR